MARVLPAPGFGHAPLQLHTIGVGARFCRLYHQRFDDPLGFGKLSSRFSDPRRRVAANRFGVLSLGTSLKVCFLEAVLRDQRDGAMGAVPIDESDLRTWQCATIIASQPLCRVDLSGDGAVRMGVPSDVHRARDQSLGRLWSVAFHDHSAKPDGILYPSRLNGETALAVFGRAVSKLRPEGVRPLIDAPGLAVVLSALEVAIV